MLRGVIIYHSNIVFFLHPIHYPCTTLALPPSSNSDAGSPSGPSSPLPTTVRAFIFIASRIQHFLPSSTRVELYLPTHAARRSQQLILPFCFSILQIKSNLITVGIELKDQR